MMTIQVRTHLWIWWADIAIQQEYIARRARARAVRLTPRGDGFGEAIDAETYAAMIAIAACSHSLDALFGAIKGVIRSNRTERRWSEILETLKAGFIIVGSAGGGRWAAELEWLYDLRDAALHFEESQKPPAPHPAGTIMGPENVLYSLEPAARAVAILLEILDTCMKNPRALLVDWANRMSPAARSLKDKQAEFSKRDE